MLGTTQTLAWASSYYLPAMLAEPMARSLGVSTSTVFAAFSLALVLSALVGPLAGHLIDRRGGRPVLIGTSVLFAGGLGLLALAQGTVSMGAAWLLLGIGMGCGLYEAAFSTVVRLYGQDARAAITGITLIAGFASTVGWPLSAWLEAHFGWRGACAGWATLHLLVGLPLNILLPSAGAAASEQHAADPEPSPTASPAADPAGTGWTTTLLACVFAATWFVSTAMAVHLPRLLQGFGVSLAAAVGIGTLVGPAQVCARVLEFGLLRRAHPLWSARLAALAHPIGALVLLTVGPAAAVAFAVLHGLGNGILTIAKGTLPLVFFGASGYGARQGWLMMPARIAQVSAPLLLGIAIDAWGRDALWLSAGVGASAFFALIVLRAHTGRTPATLTLEAEQSASSKASS